MRTKTILLSAIVGALSSVSLMAQVYSLNAVGYINVSVPAGFSIIANQLNTTNNNISPLLDSQLLDGNHNGVTIYKYDPVNGFSQVVVAGTGVGTAAWQGNATTTTLNPGEAAFVFNPLPQFNLTFVGTVLQGSLTNTLAQGFNLASAIVPVSTNLDSSTLGLVPNPGDTIYFYDPVLGYNVQYVAVSSGGGGYTWQFTGSTNTAPTPNVGQGFFYFVPPSASGNVWISNFTVN
jgi:hypothetical protein